MANPQLENGYARIANEILEALAKSYITGEERRIIDVIWRKTYGWGKKRDRIPLSQFVEATNMRKSNIADSLRSLIKKRVILLEENVLLEENGTAPPKNIVTGHIYEFNKNYNEWDTASPRRTFSSKRMIQDQSVILEEKASLSSKRTEPAKSLSSKSTSKEIVFKETSSKEKNKDPGSLPYRVEIHPVDTGSGSNGKKGGKPEKIVAYPSWLNSDLWMEFKSSRKAMKAPMTMEAERRLLITLQKLIDEGNNQDEVVGQSIERGWKGLFPVQKQNGRNRGGPLDGVISEKGQRTLANMKALFERRQGEKNAEC